MKGPQDLVRAGRFHRLQLVRVRGRETRAERGRPRTIALLRRLAFAAFRTRGVLPLETFSPPGTRICSRPWDRRGFAAGNVGARDCVDPCTP